MQTQRAKLKGLVDYSSGAIVSKEIIDNENGSIIVFSFDEGQKLSEHSAPYDAFVILIDGEGEFTIGGIAHNLKEGECILMPANIPHAVNAVKKFKMILTMIKGG